MLTNYVWPQALNILNEPSLPTFRTMDCDKVQLLSITERIYNQVQGVHQRLNRTGFHSNRGTVCTSQAFRNRHT